MTSKKKTLSTPKVCLIWIILLGLGLGTVGMSKRMVNAEQNLENSHWEVQATTTPSLKKHVSIHFKNSKTSPILFPSKKQLSTNGQTKISINNTNSNANLQYNSLKIHKHRFIEEPLHHHYNLFTGGTNYLQFKNGKKTLVLKEK